MCRDVYLKLICMRVFQVFPRKFWLFIVRTGKASKRVMITRNPYSTIGWRSFSFVSDGRRKLWNWLVFSRQNSIHFWIIQHLLLTICQSVLLFSGKYPPPDNCNIGWHRTSNYFSIAILFVHVSRTFQFNPLTLSQIILFGKQWTIQRKRERES